jgi:hypothetical protein
MSGKLFTDMSEQERELITLILGLVGDGHFDILPHARDRMKQRTVTKRDIQCAARTSHYEEVQDFARSKILFEGLDLDDDRLEVVAAYEAGVVIISLFGG